jgi:betaine-aldehyde dehydrogenase
MYKPKVFSELFIGGAWAKPLGAGTFDVISPWSEEVVASLPDPTKGDVDQAVAAARKAFDQGPWPRLSLEERAAVLRRVGEGFEKHRERLAHTITEEMGSPIAQSINIQAVVPRVMISSFIELATSREPWMLRQSSSGNGVVFREPKGVVAAIVPWNVPMMTTMMKLAPALLMGCCVILKAAQETPLSGYILGEILAEAGVPDGVVSILAADREVSEYLALHPGVDKVSFTGSTLAGRRLGALCGELVRPITLELGGKSAALILDDADLPAAVEALRMGSFRNSGQICSLKTRVVVSRKIEGEFLDRMKALVVSMPVGDPFDLATQIGPMATARQRDRVQGYIERGLAEGARLVCGGPGIPDGLDHGWFVRPTVFAGVDPGAAIAQEEIFGPVVSVMTFDSEDEAIAIANTSNYGLNGAIFSADVPRALELGRRIKTGVVEINGCGVGFHSPIGGVKQSGIGREAGFEGLDAYVEMKAIGVPKPFADSLAASQVD